MPNFSLGFVTPIWKTPYSYLKEMVESVNSLFRTGVKLNWAIVIDGDRRSIEESLKEIIDPLLLKYCFIKTLDKRYGPSFARNLGVKSLNCEFISWLDADDAIDTQNFIAVLRELASKKESFWNKYDLVYTDSYDCDLHLNVISVRKKKFLHELHCKYKKTEIGPLLSVDFVYQMQFVRKETFLSVGGFDEKRIFGEDVDLILRISDRSEQVNIFHLPLPVYYYRDNPKGRCNTSWEKLKLNMEEVYLESSKRNSFSFHAYKYAGAFVKHGNKLQLLKSNEGLNKKSLFDIYLPIIHSNNVLNRACGTYIRRQGVKSTFDPWGFPLRVKSSPLFFGKDLRNVHQLIS